MCRCAECAEVRGGARRCAEGVDGGAEVRGGVRRGGGVHRGAWRCVEA